MKPLIFISYSTGSNNSVSFADKLHDALNKAGAECFLDAKNIGTGTDYKEKIKEQLRKCDAAIVLLSEEAKKSNWVPVEVALLMEKKGVPEFKIIPVLMDSSLHIDDFGKNRFDAADLSSLQACSVRYGKYEDVLNQIISTLKPLMDYFFQCVDLFKHFENKLYKILDDNTPDTVVEFLEKMGISVPKTVDHEFARRILSRSMINSICDKDINVGELTIRPEDKKLTWKILRSSWVDPETVTNIKGTASEGGERVVCLPMDKNQERLAEMLFYRILGCYYDCAGFDEKFNGNYLSLIDFSGFTDEQIISRMGAHICPPGNMDTENIYIPNWEIISREINGREEDRSMPFVFVFSSDMKIPKDERLIKVLYVVMDADESVNRKLSDKTRQNMAQALKCCADIGRRLGVEKVEYQTYCQQGVQR